MDEKISRRDFFKLGAKAAVTFAVVTACGDLLTLGAKAKADIDKVKAPKKDGFLMKLDALEEKKAVNFQYKGKKAVLLYNDGEVRAFESKCTHKGGPLKFKGGRFVCQYHGATFDPLTGKALTRPAPEGSSLTEIILTIKDGGIYAA